MFFSVCHACDTDPQGLCFRHKVREWRMHGGLNISPAAMPNRRNHVAPRTPNNSWEKGIPTDHRGMPWLDANGSEIGQKEFVQRRSEIEAAERRRRQPALSSS